MHAAEIRARFLRYFERNGHAVRPSSSLVPAGDATLLFTNAGMVQFKQVFLGQEQTTFGRRAATAQKCVRAGGKHNDLEQVGHTARHHTFFEMLGNFSFGDYFKRDAIRFGWEFVTVELGIDPKHLRVTVFHEDDEARKLWREITNLPDSRIYGLGEKDNFWQMADTGPCGPCSEIYVDLAQLTRDWEFPEGAKGEWTDVHRAEFSQDAFVEGAEAGRFLEIWNLVFMQFDRQPDGTLVPLPKPSVDTGAGLERIAAVKAAVTSNYHTDVFIPLIQRAERATGLSYFDAQGVAPRSTARGPTKDGGSFELASFRVIADHARAVAFLLADGVFPSNEGRGYVLRRILRRAVRHAWLMGRREPTLVEVVDEVIARMGDVYPELVQRKTQVLDATRMEEERFLATIGEGMQRFEQLAPLASTQGSTAIRGTISGEDAFRLYDTFGFPVDLTELMARERGYLVDMSGFERALGAQRTQSKEERKAKKAGGAAAEQLGDFSQWTVIEQPPKSAFIGYDQVDVETDVTAWRALPGGRAAVILRHNPFYAESGGQIADEGEVVGAGWRLDVDDVRKIEGHSAVVGTLRGDVTTGKVIARVPVDVRLDTQRNHTATHLLHAALRRALGDHVHQAGSLVAPDRLRFDFTHHGPLTPEQIVAVEEDVNRGIWAAVDVDTTQRPYKDALADGAMALFGEKYGDIVRVVTVSGISRELCGGTHVRNTGAIALFKIVSENGVAAGQRRIEAVTGRRAYEFTREQERQLEAIAELVKAPVAAAAKRVKALVEERRALERRVEEATRTGKGATSIDSLLAGAHRVNGAQIVASSVTAADVKELQTLGDALREQLQSGVGVLGASFADGRNTLLVVVTDDLRSKGLSADKVVKAIAEIVGGRGGGKPHMAQAGIPDAGGLATALDRAPAIVRPILEPA